jgi:large subunit ribosomal protein L31
MKDAFHPVYVEAKISCSCGHVIETRSTKDTIKVEVCSQCHPFFTGSQRLMDTEGRIERFKNRYAKKK